eukprot:TRINITY_DN75058_c0_g1_i1.p2 TRINITY_DN75058_c0_g1~~TRINITY_DN75058_c0_g1_i1.p2  ORF type:complete len:173 (-),score=38.21 TRINITY_DN75058_c0_g1_i1:57-575(-)
MVKTLLKRCQQFRDVECVVFVTYLARKACHPVQSAFHWTKQYSEETRQKKHSLGCPHVYATTGILDAFATMKLPEAQAILDEFRKLSDARKAKVCLFCTVSRVFKEEEARITMQQGGGEPTADCSPWIHRAAGQGGGGCSGSERCPLAAKDGASASDPSGVRAPEPSDQLGG